jgi:hypothetical protein
MITKKKYTQKHDENPGEIDFCYGKLFSSKHPETAMVVGRTFC